MQNTGDDFKYGTVMSDADGSQYSYFTRWGSTASAVDEVAARRAGALRYKVSASVDKRKEEEEQGIKRQRTENDEDMQKMPYLKHR